MRLNKTYHDSCVVGLMLVLFVFLTSCSKDPPADPVDPVDPIDTTDNPNPIDTTNALTDSLAGLYKGQCYRRYYKLDIPTHVWTITLDTFDFEFELISISDDTNWIFFDVYLVSIDDLYREFHNRINGITDSLVYSGHVSEEIFYDIIVYPEAEKITFLEDGRYQSLCGVCPKGMPMA